MFAQCAGFSTRVEHLARFLRLGNRDAFAAYARTLVENKYGSDQLSDDVIARTIHALSKFDLEIYNSQQTSLVAAVMTFVGKLTNIDVGLPKETPTQISTKLINEILAIPLLLVVELGPEVIRNMYRWWNDEISGQRCAKNIIEVMGSTMGELIVGYYTLKNRLIT